MSRPPRWRAWLPIGLCVLHAVAARAVEVDLPGARLQVSGFLDGLAIIRTEPSADQRPLVSGTLRVSASFSKAFRSFLEVRGSFGGTPEDEHAGMHDCSHSFQNYSPAFDVREAWGEWRASSLEVRAGVQRFAWGALDGVPPTDVLNPRDFRDPFVSETEETKLGIPSLQALWHPKDVPALGLRQLHAALVYVPFAVPSRLPVTEERWFPAGARPTDLVTLPAQSLDLAVSKAAKDIEPELAKLMFPSTQIRVLEDVDVPVTVDTANHRPPLRVDRGALAARVGGTAAGVDWNLYHYTGPETGPNLDLRVRAIVSKASLGRCGNTNGVNSCDFTLKAGGRAILTQADDTIHMTGFDLAWRLGDVAMRAEGAYFQDRPTLRIARELLPTGPQLLRRLQPATRCVGTGLLAAARKFREGHPIKPGQPVELPTELRAGRCETSLTLGDLFVDRDTVEWGVGADYFWHETFLLAQINQIIGLDDAPRLIIADPETRFTAVVRRRMMQDRLEFEVRSIYSVERGGWFVFPRISYAITDALRARIGYLAVGGSRNSLIGEFGRNDEVVLQLRYSF